VSLFLAGKLQFGRSLSDKERTEVAFALSEAALRNRMAIQLGCNIVQPTVFQIIETDLATLVADDEVTFLLTGSPISNVSDELIDYWADSSEEAAARVHAHGEHLMSCFAAFRAAGPLVSVELFISEGYDTFYREEIVELTTLSERLVKLAEEENWNGYPSIKLVIPLKT